MAATLLWLDPGVAIKNVEALDSVKAHLLLQLLGVGLHINRDASPCQCVRSRVS